MMAAPQPTEQGHVRGRVLVNCCVDFRFVDPLVDWLRVQGLRGQYDLRTHESASLAIDRWVDSDVAIDRLRDKPVSTAMTENPTTLRLRDKIAFALHRMNVGGFRHIPLVDDNDRLVGVISIRGILAYLTERQLA